MPYPLSRWLLAAAVFLAVPAAAQEKRAMTWTDVMQFQAIERPVIADDGAWVAFTATPDRGDGEAVVQATQGGPTYTIPLGHRPVLSADSRWAAMTLQPSMAATEAAEDDAKPKPGMVLLNLASGDTTVVPRVQGFAFSSDGRWLAVHHHALEPAEDDTTDAERSRGEAGTLVVLHDLGTRRFIEIPYAAAFAFDDRDEASRYLAYTAAAPDSSRDGLYLRDLQADGTPELTVDARPFGHYTHLTWREDAADLAFLASTLDDDGDPGDAALWRWADGTATELLAADALAAAYLPSKNTLHWSDDGTRLFFGYRPVGEREKGERGENGGSEDEEAEEVVDPYDVEALLDDVEGDVWHWDDPRIKPHEKQWWEQAKDRTYRAVVHLPDRRVVILGNPTVQAAAVPEDESAVMLGRSDQPYLKEMTWDGFYADAYLIDLADGSKTKIADRLDGTPSLSPGGRFAVYYHDRQWHLYDVARGTTRPVTDGLGVPFADEDHDYPEPAPGYGTGGWVDDAGVLIYDKYDVWYVPTDGSAPVNWTGGEGRATARTFRVVHLDPDKTHFAPGDRVLLEAYHNTRKHDAFYEARIGTAGVTPLLEAPKRFDVIAKAEDAEVVLYTREDYDEFPDLWMADPAFQAPIKLTTLGRQLEPFAWGTSELVAWTDVDGDTLQGVVIKPGTYDPSRRYPVLVYYYRFMSQRLHAFNQPHVNHRPAFGLWASNDYLIFLPDVRFEIGRPGFSATKALVPGVQKLVDLGWADPDAIGLHGHSWSGYQTAFVVTQTDIFAAAIAGAPVSNMTSAYSGIRWGSGLARQFQYEQSQSRLGTSLWTGRDRYIDNSPVFFADRIHTPLLIQHGDADGAVPWYQSIELYLACRRLDKDCVFLQYHGEDHHLAKYPNKLDYAMKMKQYFDHYLKGERAPAWITDGVPFEGE